MKPTTLLILGTVALAGCKESFLDAEPLVGSTAANYYQSAGDAEAAIVACYNPLQQEVTTLQGSGQLATHFRWYFGDIVSDDSDKGGSGDGDEPELLLFEQFSGQDNARMLLGEWQSAYRGIAYCNLALANIPTIEMDSYDQSRFLAEAKFIRAYWYFNLVTTFGGVPLILENLAPSEYQQPRATAETIWDQIETDLTEAIEFLPVRSAISLNELGRATKGAGNALLLKAYAYQSKWAEAQPIAEEIVGSGEYALAPDYASIFSLEGENGPGSIFEIQFMNASGGNWGNSLEGTFTNVFQRARGQFGGYGFNLPTQNFVDEFENGDPRLAATVFQEGDVMGDRGLFTLDATGFEYPYYSRKYFSNAADDAPFGDPNPNGPSNDRVIRYADVLLLHAEAAYHNGFEEIARSSVNAVRARARGGNSAILPDVTSGGVDLLEAIYHERRVELGLEGHRFFDLVRQGRAATVLAPLGFSEGTHELFPIPAAEITLSGGLIDQNPGY
jgi:hypothetical protein